MARVPVTLFFLLLAPFAIGASQANGQTGEKSRGESGSRPDPSLRLYLATVAAAEASLRLHETDRAKYWLAEAPTKMRGWEWRYLSAMADRSSRVVDPGQGSITDVGVSPDGRFVATGGADSTARLIEVATGAVVRTFRGHTAAVWSPVFSADGRRLVTASSDGSVRIWEVATGREQLVLSGNGHGVAAVAWSPDDSRVVVSSWLRTNERGVWGVISVWDARSGAQVTRFEHGIKPIGSIGFTPDGSRLVVGTWDSDLSVFDTGTWKKVHELKPPESEDYKALYGFAISPDGRRAAAAYADQRVRLWDLQEGKLVATLYTPVEGQLKPINEVAFLPGGTRIATAGADRTVRLWDVASGRELLVLHGHERTVNSVSAGPDGRTLYSAGADGTLRMWDLETLAPEHSVWPQPTEAYTIAFDPDGRSAVTANWQGWIRVHDLASGREVRAWQGHEESGVGVDWSPDGRWIASTGNDGRVVLWDAATGRLIRELQKRRGQILAAAFSPDGSMLAAPGSAGTVQLWRLPSGDSLVTLGDPGGAGVGYLAWSPDGASLAAGSSDGVVRIFDVKQRGLSHRLELGARGTVALSYRPDGRRLVAGAGRIVRIWDPTDGRQIGRPRTKPGTVLSLAYSPDGTRISAGLGGNTFEVWDADADQVMLRLPQTAVAWYTTWSKEGDLALIPLDETIRILRAGRASTSDKTGAAAAAPQAQATDTAWREHLAYLSRGSGVWVASNAQYRSDQNQEPHTYGQRYWMGFGRTAQHGCLWGASPRRNPMVFWHFFTAWDPAREELLVQQSGSNGVVGIGYESPETGIAVQTFTGPDGVNWETRHVSDRTRSDTLITRSFRRANGEWQPQRSYTWIRQPAGTAAPCG
jgi:WD40 repeat protein